jgi:hypothetical protein
MRQFCPGQVYSTRVTQHTRPLYSSCKFSADGNNNRNHVAPAANEFAPAAASHEPTMPAVAVALIVPVLIPVAFVVLVQLELG